MIGRLKVWEGESDPPYDCAIQIIRAGNWWQKIGGKISRVFWAFMLTPCGEELKISSLQIGDGENMKAFHVSVFSGPSLMSSGVMTAESATVIRAWFRDNGFSQSDVFVRELRGPV